MKNPPKRVFVVVSYRTDQANSVCYGAVLTSAALTGSKLRPIVLTRDISQSRHYLRIHTAQRESADAHSPDHVCFDP